MHGGYFANILCKGQLLMLYFKMQVFIKKYIVKISANLPIQIKKKNSGWLKRVEIESLPLWGRFEGWVFFIQGRRRRRPGLES